MSRKNIDETTQQESVASEVVELEIIGATAVVIDGKVYKFGDKVVVDESSINLKSFSYLFCNRFVEFYDNPSRTSSHVKSLGGYRKNTHVVKEQGSEFK